MIRALLAFLLLCSLSVATKDGLRIHGISQDTPMTDDERIAYAKRIIEEVKARLEKKQLEDLTKDQFCKKETYHLAKDLDETQKEVMKEKHQRQIAELAVDKCGCCCDDLSKLEYELILAKRDVEFQEKRLKLLDSQAEHLENWCAS
eukprot:TRINITY_DN51975_c0_g1_i1.p2 TRINITY_DN51975_c0_g1~~TRINITY_DN51975_c0_g1_i1.p2  ORF type:complete len:147 (-),score=52.07 TRINITY_DN51975_c0_g1_i1:12-452(-)